MAGEAEQVLGLAVVCLLAAMLVLLCVVACMVTHVSAYMYALSRRLGEERRLTR